MNEIIGTRIYRKCQFPEKNVTVSTIYNGNYILTGETTLFGKNLNQKFNSLIANPITTPHTHSFDKNDIPHWS